MLKNILKLSCIKNKDINYLINIFILLSFFKIINAQNISLKYNNKKNNFTSNDTTALALTLCLILFAILGCYCGWKK